MNELSYPYDYMIRHSYIICGLYLESFDDLAFMIKKKKNYTLFMSPRRSLLMVVPDNMCGTTNGIILR